MATLLTLFRARGREVFQTLRLSDQTNIANAKKAFNAYFTPQMKEVFEKYRFHSTVQPETESVETQGFSGSAVISITCDFSMSKTSTADSEQDKTRDCVVFQVRCGDMRVI